MWINWLLTGWGIGIVTCMIPVIIAWRRALVEYKKAQEQWNMATDSWNEARQNWYEALRIIRSERESGR